MFAVNIIDHKISWKTKNDFDDSENKKPLHFEKGKKRHLFPGEFIELQVL